MTSNDPNALAAESAIRQIGTEFRRLRTLRGERIEDIATYLDIKATFLFGIEQGDLSGISGKREAKSVMRNYANYLGLDGDGIVSPMDPIIASLGDDKAPSVSEDPRGFDRTSVGILAASMILGVLVGWTWIGDANEFDLLTTPTSADGLDGESEVPELETPAGGESSAVDDEPAADDAAASLEEQKTVLALTPEGQPSGVASVDVVGDPANVLAALVAQRGDGAHIYEADNTDARVIVRALADVSVQVASHGRDYVWSRTMRPREMLLVPNRDDLELWSGDAAGVEILLDGVILPPFGTPGTAIGGLSLTPSFLEAVPADALDDDRPKPTF